MVNMFLRKLIGVFLWVMKYKVRINIPFIRVQELNFSKTIDIFVTKVYYRSNSV
jgi:type IV secretory pathway VirB3-like protein